MQTLLLCVLTKKGVLMPIKLKRVLTYCTLLFIIIKKEVQPKWLLMKTT